LTSHDQLAKELFQTFFAGLVRLAAPDVAVQLRLDEAEFLNQQMFTDWPEGDRREVDLLASVPTVEESGGRVLIHVEVEAQARSRMRKRVWQYSMQIRLRFDLPVLSILINLRGGRAGVRRERLRERFGDEEAVRFQYRAFSLSGCQAAEYLALPEPLAWALAALMRPGTWSRAEQKIECLRRVAAADLPARSRLLLGNWIETYIQLDERDAAEYDRLRSLASNEEVKTMELTWAERMELQGVEKGMEKGLEQGLTAGIQALRQVVVRLLGRRFGPVPETVQRKVEAIDSMESLGSLAEKVLEVESIEEMGLS
jgi:hypothetical protein